MFNSRMEQSTPCTSTPRSTMTKPTSSRVLSHNSNLTLVPRISFIAVATTCLKLMLTFQALSTRPWNQPSLVNARLCMIFHQLPTTISLHTKNGLHCAISSTRISTTLKLLRPQTTAIAMTISAIISESHQ